MLSRRHMLATCLAATPFAASAQTRYPVQPVRVVVPFGAGGLADVTMRVVAEKLGERLGQRFVVVNQPGAGGTAAARAVLGSAADGYTLALFTNGTAISVPLVASLGYDPLTQFVPVSSLGFFDFLFVTSAGHAYTSLGDFLKAAKAEPGKLNIGTINVGSTQNLTAVLFKDQAGIDAQIIPFRTTPDAVTALLRKDIDLLIDGYVAVGSLIEDGKLRALATTGPVRFPRLAHVPTAIESGLPAFDVTSWNAVFAPAGTPADILQVLNEALVVTLADDNVKARLLELGIEARSSTPTALAERLRSDIAKWGKVITTAGITRQ